MLPGFSRIDIGEQSVVLQVSYDNTVESVRAVGQLYRRLQGAAGVRSFRLSTDCLALEFHSADDIDPFLQRLTETPAAEVDVAAERTLRIPVCYQKPFAADLDSVAAQLRLDPQEIIRMHFSQTYEVWMIGFMPGFPYMGQLPEALRLGRKDKPDRKIAAGSVAIAEEFVGIYPFDSPGGWHVIGRTPVTLVDYFSDSPFLFDYGVRVLFEPIEADQFESIVRGRAA